MNVMCEIGKAYERSARNRGAGEFSYGSGLDAPGTEDLPPSQGGRYRGTSPPCEKTAGVSCKFR